jgi:hypothetical protein
MLGYENEYVSGTGALEASEAEGKYIYLRSHLLDGLGEVLKYVCLTAVRRQGGKHRAHEVGALLTKERVDVYADSRVIEASVPSKNLPSAVTRRSSPLLQNRRSFRSPESENIPGTCARGNLGMVAADY